MFDVAAGVIVGIQIAFAVAESLRARRHQLNGVAPHEQRACLRFGRDLEAVFGTVIDDD